MEKVRLRRMHSLPHSLASEFGVGGGQLVPATTSPTANPTSPDRATLPSVPTGLMTARSECPYAAWTAIGAASPAAATVATTAAPAASLAFGNATVAPTVSAGSTR